MITHYYSIKSESDAVELIKMFEEKCLLAKKSFLSLFNGGETDISKEVISKLIEITEGVEAISNWLSDLDAKYKKYYEELNTVLNEDELMGLCNEITSLYVTIDNDIIYGINLRDLTLSEECKANGSNVIDIFCTNYPFGLSFDDFAYNIYEN